MSTREARRGIALVCIFLFTLPASIVSGRTSSPASGIDDGGQWQLIQSFRRAVQPEAFLTGDDMIVVDAAWVAFYRRHEDSWSRAYETPWVYESEGSGQDFTSAWSGEDLILWGGGAVFEGVPSSKGAIFDADTKQWRPLPPAPIKPLWYSNAVWTGREAIFWGGLGSRDESNKGVAFDPSTNTWRELPPAPFRAYAHTAVWTGKEMIVWGGSDDSEAEGRIGCPRRFIDTGAAYDPRTDTWRMLPDSPLEARGWHAAVWTGKEMIVWGGGAGFCSERKPRDGAAFNPRTNEWRRLPRAPIRGRQELTAVWTGKEMVVWGGEVSGFGLDSGAAYDPKTDRWRLLSAAPIGGRFRHAAAWTGEEMFVYGGWTYRDRPYRDGAVWRPRT